MALQQEKDWRAELQDKIQAQIWAAAIADSPQHHTNQGPKKMPVSDKGPVELSISVAHKDFSEQLVYLPHKCSLQALTLSQTSETSRAEPGPVGFAPAHGGPGGGVARARCAGPGGRSPGRAQAEGGGAVSLESGAPSGRGRDAGCCGSGGRAGGDVTGSPSRHLRSLGLWVTGRPAAGPRRRRQRDLPTVMQLSYSCAVLLLYLRLKTQEGELQGQRVASTVSGGTFDHYLCADNSQIIISIETLSLHFRLLYMTNSVKF
ncbi:uncharacterized protein LOC116644212 [Phoca vitulina]|uniref:uncharacterized protein LOC116644212 n=1 Tax=Phoca vitulina TaxID=9720 RepID=UPI0013963C79|nr:uncharacterized protein LOC116644212 [Phoca vitulina]